VEQDTLELEAEIYIEGVRNAPIIFQNNKLPGDNGFTKEFYEVFFELVDAALLDSLNAGFENGTLSISERSGIIYLFIFLFPKDENNLTTLFNWSQSLCSM